MTTQTQHMINKKYNCPLTHKHVNLQLKKIAGRSRSTVCATEPELCSNIGECGCGVVKIIYGMSYTVDWKKCSLYSSITEQ
ncbi:MAG: hypothetical protein D3924_00870 [Candidatus Electrothrix sp. AR4]|nr:hypothetical protein [Candidatus Electrothrix sp. AR4]